MIDLDTESNVLNALCLYDECLRKGIISLTDDDFYDQVHQAIFKQIKEMVAQGTGVNLASVAKECGPLISKSRFLFIQESFVSRATFDFYVKKLKGLKKTRELVTMAEKIIKAAKDNADVDAIVQFAEDDVYKIMSESNEDPVISPKEQAMRMYESIEKRMNSKNNGGIKTSYWKLNRILNGGYQPGELHIISAETGKGKTAFTMNLMRDVAIVQKRPSLYINTEMNQDQMANRWMAILSNKETGITYQDLATGRITDEQLDYLLKSPIERMSNSGFYSIDVPDLNIDKLNGIIQKFALQTQLKFAVVDYIGRMDTLSSDRQSWEILLAATKQLKTLAQKHKITVIMLAQVTDTGKLQGAKAMKNECDTFAELKEMSESQQERYNPFNYILEVSKNRNGPTGNVLLDFEGNRMTFIGEKPKGDEEYWAIG